MSWFASVMKGLQKERNVSLMKAQKVDGILKGKLFQIEQTLGTEGKNEIVQIQAALTYAFQKAAIIKEIQKDVASMGEDVAVDEKVTLQWLKVKRFVTAELSYLKRDAKNTVKDAKQLPAVIKNQITALQKLLKYLEEGWAWAAQGHGRLALSKTQKVANAERQAVLRRQIEACKAEITRLRTIQSLTEWSSRAKSIEKYYADLEKALDHHTLPDISQLSETPEVKEFRAMMRQEMRAMLMVLQYMDKQCEHFEAIGVPLLSSSQKSRLARAGFSLGQAIP
jgi:hypothetical protein